MNIFPKILLAVAFPLFIIACSKDNSTTPPDTSPTLTAQVVASASAPDVNSSVIESVWASSTAMAVSVSPMGKSFTGDPSSFQVSLKAIRTDQDVYFLAEYDDATQDMLRQPVKFKGGNFFDMKNWSFEKNTYDDGFSLLFERDPGTSGAKTFNADGCAMLCHETRTIDWDPGMFSESAGRYDVWYWNAGKSNGCGLANDGEAIGSPNFQMVKDAPSDEIYLYNVIDSFPYLIAGGNNLGLDAKYFIAEATAQTFDATATQNPSTNSAWKAGDRVPGYYIKAENGLSSYYDVKARGYYSGGKWHVKFKRTLNRTGDELDVTFIPGNEYGFSFAVHNHNSPGNHYGVADKKFTLKL